MKNTAVLLVQCPNRKGLDATIAEFIYRYDGNILHFEQHQAGEGRYFLARVEWELADFRLDMKDFDGAFGPLAHKFGMNWCIALGNHRPRVATFVSKYDHCLVDLLYRQRNGELACDFPLIISNHPDARVHADFYGVPFHLIPVTKDNKPQAEAQQLTLLAANNIEVVVLARYMQVLSADFLAQSPMPIINIHHSFLPAFIGAKPHQQAYERGVKLIGATAHYVSEILGDGPIIEQGVTRISHRDSPEDLVEKGRDLEKIVLSRAVRWHIENRILLYNNKTIIFE
ncbi:MAG TPA: formyltetrahydrofolate deformylase [Candidatus Acidoferrum sp.]|nr:formyltetrahydrofolate deformylase [Candidatus Acidoferrum sp.]